MRLQRMNKSYCNFCFYSMIKPYFKIKDNEREKISSPEYLITACKSGVCPLWSGIFGFAPFSNKQRSRLSIKSFSTFSIATVKQLFPKSLISKLLFFVPKIDFLPISRLPGLQFTTAPFSISSFTSSIFPFLHSSHKSLLPSFQPRIFGLEFSAFVFSHFESLFLASTKTEPRSCRVRILSSSTFTWFKIWLKCGFFEK